APGRARLPAAGVDRCAVALREDKLMRKLFVAATLLAAAAARADDLTLHAFVDGYYAWNGNRPASHENFVPGTGTTAERANEFNLNLAAVELVRDPKPVGVHL